MGEVRVDKRKEKEGLMGCAMHTNAIDTIPVAGPKHDGHAYRVSAISGTCIPKPANQS